MDDKVSSTLFRYGVFITMMSVLAKVIENMYTRYPSDTENNVEEEPAVIDAEFTHAN